MAESNILEKTSEEVIELKCGPCSPDIYVIAYGYCKTCSEFLCETCFNVHLRIPPCRNHDLVEQKDMPEDVSLLKTNGVCTETCSIHDDKVIEFFCEVHSVFGCSICIFKDHRRCEGLICISEVADGVYDSQEFKGMKTDIDTAYCRNRINLIDLEGKKSKVEKASQRATKDANDFATRLKDFIDQLKNVTVNKIAEIKEKELERLNSLSNKCDEYHTKIRLLGKGINDSQSVGAKCNSFIAMKKANIELKTVSSQLNTLHQQIILNNDVDESYRENPDLVTIFDTVTDLGIWSVSGDEDQHEDTVTFILKDVSKLKDSRRQSKASNIYGLPWSILAFKNETHLSFHLDCNIDASNRSWSCHASADLMIINQVSRNLSKDRAIDAVFKEGESCWGYNDFIKIDKLIDPDNGFCVDDSIILEACIMANKPEGI